MAHHPLDWNRDGRIGMGDGAITEMLVNELGRHGGGSRDSGGCGCGCFLVAVVVIVVLVFVLCALGGR